jgi:2OG-Fe(II) oxygenase superfamily
MIMAPPPAVSTGPMIPPSVKLFTEPQLLRRNLRDYGWSPVLVDVSVLSKMIEDEDDHGANKKPLILLQHHRDWTTLHERMFDQTTFGPSVTYRRAESGSPGSLVEEPKQSLELKRVATTTTTTNDEQKYEVQARMKSWITILHAVAWTVAKNLDWPDDTLIAKNNNNNVHGGAATKKDDCGDDVDDAPPMDLLRAFLYDAVPSTTQSPSDEEVSLGSSPHTDWGSLTVVWQDRVGGLETFCRHNNCWVPVPAAPVPDDDDDNNFLPLIIHIGDVTSLAMLGGGSSDTTDGNSVWPSPLHRVRSPKMGRRRSLVYFCYPTPKAGSLQNLQHLLKSEDFRADYQHDQVRFEQYSVLQNQSLLLGGKQQQPQPIDARNVYERILHQPLVEVFMEKWSQVQR